MDNFEAIRQMIDNIAAKNMVDANLGFEGIMSDKVSAALDAKRQSMASTMFGGKSNETDVESTSGVPADADQ